MQWSPAFLAPGTSFVEDNFSTDWWGGDGSKMISRALHLCALYFSYYISSTSDHQALDPRGWGLLPWWISIKNIKQHFRSKYLSRKPQPIGNNLEGKNPIFLWPYNAEPHTHTHTHKRTTKNVYSCIARSMHASAKPWKQITHLFQVLRFLWVERKLGSKTKTCLVNNFNNLFSESLY